MSKGTKIRNVRVPDDLWDEAMSFTMTNGGGTVSGVIREALERWVEDQRVQWFVRALLEERYEDMARMHDARWDVRDADALADLRDEQIAELCRIGLEVTDEEEVAPMTDYLWGRVLDQATHTDAMDPDDRR